MHSTELQLLAVVVVVVGLIVLAYATAIPYPILMVFGGAALGFAPGIPSVTLDPQVVLLVLLPPLLYAAAFFSSVRDLRANVRPISLLAVGLVLFTMTIVAVVAHAVIDHLSWAVCFTLGAIVSPTDPAAASAIARRLGAPARVLTVVEGESLINDATGLVAYKVALAAVVAGTFSASDATLHFVLNTTAGVAVGLAVGWLIATLRRDIDDPPTEMAISLAGAYLAYLPAAAIGVSGVVAAVTVGIYLGWRSPELISPSTRIQVFSMWEILTFLLNAALFTLVGLQLPSILDHLGGFSPGTLIGYGALTAGTVILVRIAWVFPLTYLPRVLFRHVREHDPAPSWKSVVLVAWSGMRGAVSLAAALALPLTTDSGAPFPARDLVIFLVYAVIVGTLVLQGLTYPLLIKVLGVEDDGRESREEAKARIKAARAAIRRIDELAGEDWVRDETAERMRAYMDYRSRRFAARFDDEDDGAYDVRSEAYQRLQLEVLAAQRAEIIRLRNEGTINDTTMHRIERDLDLEYSRLEVT